MLLDIANLSKSYGGLKVLRDVSFGVAGREILGLIGPNGAGKTTLFNAITGMIAPSGEIRFRGESILGLRPDEICRRGLVRTFQAARVFPTMTALENVVVGARFGGRLRGLRAVERAQHCLELFRLNDVRNTVSARLTYAHHRLLEIARAYAAGPELVLLDEPLSGLSETESEQVLEVVTRMRDGGGTSVLWIEHQMEAIIRFCDRVLVLDHGEKIAEGRPLEVAAHPRVVEAYLGAALT
jgi:branched-chain amino acid transport system ATP-binding protein